MSEHNEFLDWIEYNCKGAHVATGAAASCECCLVAFGIDRRDTKGRFRSIDDMQEELYAYNDGGFSWYECDTCSSTFGGDRHAAHMEVGGVWHHIEVCTECLIYFANGHVPEVWYRTPAEMRAAS